MTEIEAAQFHLGLVRSVYYTFVMRETQNKTTISVRLSADEERTVRRLAKRKKGTISDVIRDAVAGIVENEQQAISRPYDDISDLIGSVTGLPSNLSEGSGDQFAAILREKAGRRK
jgi:hypothetical protein